MYIKKASQEKFLEGMRNVANSVTVITTMDENKDYGATVSSFCSVSADPPTILICLYRAGRFCEILKDKKDFCVNILPASAKNIAERFAGLHDEKVPDRFSGIQTEKIGQLPLMIGGSTAFHCFTTNIVNSSTHDIYIAEVKGVFIHNEKPLLHFNKQFHVVGETV